MRFSSRTAGALRDCVVGYRGTFSAVAAECAVMEKTAIDDVEIERNPMEVHFR